MDLLEKYEQQLKNFQDQWNIFDEDTRSCRICGCTWNNACSGGCYWITDDLCSQCVKYAGTDIDRLENES